MFIQAIFDLNKRTQKSKFLYAIWRHTYLLRCENSCGNEIQTRRYSEIQLPCMYTHTHTHTVDCVSLLWLVLPPLRNFDSLQYFRPCNAIFTKQFDFNVTFYIVCTSAQTDVYSAVRSYYASYTYSLCKLVH